MSRAVDVLKDELSAAQARFEDKRKELDPAIRAGREAKATLDTITREIDNLKEAVATLQGKTFQR